MISHDVEFVAEYADTTGLFFEGNVVTSKRQETFSLEIIFIPLRQTVWQEVCFQRQLPERMWCHA